MLRLHKLVGHEDDAVFGELLHELRHRDGVELLHVPPTDAGRKRFRSATDRGTDCAVSIGRDETLTDGALLHIDRERAIIVRLRDEAVWRLRPRDQAAALKLGWNAGNLHWRVRFERDSLAILLDGPVDEYRARILPLLDEDDVQELGDV